MLPGDFHCSQGKIQTLEPDTQGLSQYATSQLPSPQHPELPTALLPTLRVRTITTITWYVLSYCLSAWYSFLTYYQFWPSFKMKLMAFSELLPHHSPAGYWSLVPTERSTHSFGSVYHYAFICLSPYCTVSSRAETRCHLICHSIHSTCHSTWSIN